MQGLTQAFGAAHQDSILFSIALALLLAQTSQLERAAALHRIPGELGPQVAHTLKDARALAALLRERGEDADAMAVERSFSL